MTIILKHDSYRKIFTIIIDMFSFVSTMFCMERNSAGDAPIPYRADLERTCHHAPSDARALTAEMFAVLCHQLKHCAPMARDEAFVLSYASRGQITPLPNSRATRYIEAYIRTLLLSRDP